MMKRANLSDPAFAKHYATIKDHLTQLLSARCLCSRPFGGTFLHYGISEMTGVNQDDERAIHAFAKEIESVITRYEPRLSAVSVSIEVSPQATEALLLSVTGNFTLHRENYHVTYHSWFDRITHRFMETPL